MSLNVKPSTIFTGDNLEILRGFNTDSVDLVYLDPPFNSNRNYSAPIGSQAAGAAFKDTWTWDDVKAEELGLLADEYPGVYSVINATADAHGKPMQAYLIMMASRLIELRRILKETGSIYLHCDPTASHYLKLLMDSIWGGGQLSQRTGLVLQRRWCSQERLRKKTRHTLALCSLERGALI